MTKKMIRQRRKCALFASVVKIVIFFLGVNTTIILASCVKNQETDISLSVLQEPQKVIKNMQVDNQSITVFDKRERKYIELAKNQKIGAWNLMAVIKKRKTKYAVFENLTDRKGNIIYISREGESVCLPKSLEPTFASESSFYLGKTYEEITQSKKDILAEEILKKDNDPTFEEVAACLPPLRVPTFVGTNHCVDKPTFEYGGFSNEIYVDVGKVFPVIHEQRLKYNVWEGLIGGWLPVVRYLFPLDEGAYWEEVIFADETSPNYWTQPTWFRVILVQDEDLKEVHYFYHHLPYPPRGEPEARLFYEALLEVYLKWQVRLKPLLKINVPEPRIREFCLHCLAREIITRVGNHPKYGYPPLGGIDILGGYGYANVDTFQDVFNTSVSTFLEWGDFERARDYIEDYFANTVRDDGSLDTRGPEIGQYARMLTVIAQYYNFTKDKGLIEKHIRKIKAIVDLLLRLRKESKEVPKDDVSYGIIRGWSEHDSALKFNPYRFVLPHFSNNAEAARAFHDLGIVLFEIGNQTGNKKISDLGKYMQDEAKNIKEDLYIAITKSIDRSQLPPYLPAVAKDTPTWGKGRVYCEMLHSGVLDENMAQIIHDYQSANGGRILGLPGGGRGISGFLAYGPAYSYIQHDKIKEFILYYYACMAHIYSRGTWTAVEGSGIDGSKRGPYCTPAQLIIPLLTKWMLIFEEPLEPVVWLAKATPRSWLEQGKEISVAGAYTRFGRVDYKMQSQINNDRIQAEINLPKKSLGATIKVRFRVPGGKKIVRVLMNNREWKDFNSGQETVTIAPGFKGGINLVAIFQ